MTGDKMTMKRCYWSFFGIFLLTLMAVSKIGSANDNIARGGGDGSNSGVNDVRSKRPVTELTEENWRLMLKGEWMVEFFAPWCPACKNLAPTWERFAATSADLNINVAKIDVTTSTSLSGRFFVTALPTIYHVKDGDFRQYRGSRDFDALMFFIKQKQWSKLEPISAWKKPDTIHMSILSYIFKLSHTLKEFNARLQEEYGLPSWAAYAFFAIGTIFVGAALGLMLVCVIDFLYSPKKSTPYGSADVKHKRKLEVEDLANDEIEDDASQNNAEDNDEEEASTEEEQIEEEEEDGSTSEGEKNSRSESEDVDSKKKSTEKMDTILNEMNTNKPENNHQTEKPIEQKTTANPSDVRKRKPRKAD